jgi:hypothetical protein
MARQTYNAPTSRKERESASASPFPKMGETLIQNLVNVSGNRSPYTMTTPKKTMGRGKSPTGTMAVRGRTQIREANGPQFHVSTTLYHQNAAEASQVLRNTKMVPPTITRPDHVGSAATFWQKRKYANQRV